MLFVRTSRTARVALVAVGVSALALLALAFALRSPASAQDPGTTVLTFTELEKGSTFKHVRNTKSASRQSNLLGDLIVFTNPMADAAGKAVGRLHAVCVTTTGASNFLRSKLTCDGVIALAGGTMTLQAITGPGSATTTGAITGGTGAYANARGVFVSTERKNGGSDDTITLVR
ncbi:MAG TPA: hypothetical protein VNA28_09410 [Solirubrobacteraceae bacterium]|nr:hypothetical protein [Solirubrobacteraceae bacterium]